LVEKFPTVLEILLQVVRGILLTHTVYQALGRHQPSTSSRAAVTLGLDIGADMKTAV